MLRSKRSGLVTRAESAVGFTVKSGWASAVLMTGSATTPSVSDSRRVELSDPAIPESRQPYHAGFGTARSAGDVLSRLVASVEDFGQQSVAEVIRHYQTASHHIRGVGVVVGSLIDPERIGNDHIRIHALEGRLFRRVVEGAAAQSRLRCWIWRERDLYSAAAEILAKSEQALRRTLAELGRAVPGSWRAEQKAATLAAWLVLAGPAPASHTSRGRGREA